MIRDLGSIYVNPSTIAEWDYAGPAAVLLAAGGHVSDFNKQALPINSHSAHHTGIIFSSHDEHYQLVDRLQDMRP
jgi:3'-phosphoadenosine 5'-phosphosulfate (PAPS) 3'-phosphatase